MWHEVQLIHAVTAGGHFLLQGSVMPCSPLWQVALCAHGIVQSGPAENRAVKIMLKLRVSFAFF